MQLGSPIVSWGVHERRELATRGWVLLDASPVLNLSGGAVLRWLDSLGSQLASSSPAWVHPVSAVTEVREVEESPCATLRAGPVPFHTDGMYLHYPPRYVVLLCEQPSNYAGETLLVRGDTCLSHLEDKLRRRLKAEKLWIRTGAFRSAKHLVCRHPDDDAEVLVFFDPALDVNGALQTAEGSSADDVILAVRTAVANTAPDRHSWRRGDVLVLDNYRVLHGRTPYRGSRVLLRLTVGPYAGAPR